VSTTSDDALRVAVVMAGICIAAVEITAPINGTETI
jgi:hypothetical protein